MIDEEYSRIKDKMPPYFESLLKATIESNINTLFNISKSNLKSNVHPDTIKAILVPYSNLGFKETGLCCASSYYQLYNSIT